MTRKEIIQEEIDYQYKIFGSPSLERVIMRAFSLGESYQEEKDRELLKEALSKINENDEVIDLYRKLTSIHEEGIKDRDGIIKAQNEIIELYKKELNDYRILKIL